ncbi:MAG: nicotinate-nucleotide adenylyltransferase [Caldilineaceae bacterium]|nr:nicotinate-nucleotide adenylyltransferase [Caldilineaceae bacterium]
MKDAFAELSPQPRVGVLGGTFDPIHLGHLILAEEARIQLQLDRVYLVPAGEPPHKQDQIVTPIEHRVRMVELATAESMHLWVSRIDADRPGPHYSADMIRLLQAEIGAETELFFLLGMDSLRDMPTWHEPQWLVEHCRLAVLPRPGVSVEMQQLEQALPGIQNRVILLDMPAIEIASRTLRERIRQGISVRFQITGSVEAYICKYGLYQS